MYHYIILNLCPSDTSLDSGKGIMPMSSALYAMSWKPQDRIYIYRVDKLFINSEDNRRMNAISSSRFVIYEWHAIDRCASKCIYLRTPSDVNVTIPNFQLRLLSRCLQFEFERSLLYLSCFSSWMDRMLNQALLFRGSLNKSSLGWRASFTRFIRKPQGK